ncbi:TadE/TadG family type IV pilus assembly protein [Mesorhizobium sp. 8]|uniref:TadE/TadG family type IV pilus assembly protein n=1 Tax=Mesorhizobium sp. 8 TaxID=2584466 RepID=UPI00111F74CD|nr:TadE/TadG family type IV pilus assembly protein [Mesorhizobium sp. 8]QDC02854.1 pilus assembly protein [Mesorhizobium sp. 8]
MASAGAHGAMRKLAAGIRRLCADRSGVAAVEFAFIAPVLLILYFITMEASQGLETSRKVARLGFTVADLVSQQSQVNTETLGDIVAVAASTMQPYHRSTPTITITAITITSEGPTVEWRYKTGEATDNTINVPAKLNVPDSFLLQVTSTLDYKPIIAWSGQNVAATGLISSFGDITMSNTYYVRPRVTLTVPCSNCPGS